MTTSSTTRRLGSPLILGLIVFLLALPALALLRESSAPHYGISEQQAARIARSDREVRQLLRGREVTGTRVTPLDERAQRVSFFDGARTILDAAVAGRRVTQIANKPDGAPESGSEIANFPPVLALLTGLFLLATLTVPLRSLRNLDAFAMASFVAPIVLLNENYVLASVFAAYPPLIYLAVRCMCVGLGIAAAPAPGASVFWQLTRRWPAAQRRRVSRYAVLAAALAVAMIVPSSLGASDVAMAGVAGATDLLHGISPYGHIPGFIYHGDTYPLLNYVLYVPGALLIPFVDGFSDPTGALLVAGAAVLLAAAGLYRVGAGMAGVEAEAEGGEDAGFAGRRVALAWLTFPPLMVAASGGSNDLLLAACVVAAFACFDRRALSTGLLGVAAWVKVLPVLAIPIWLARLSLRGAALALAGLVALSALLVGWLLVLGGGGAVTGMLDGLAFQVERNSLHSLWLGLGITPLQPVAMAALLGAVATATVAVRRDAELGADLRRMAALFGGVMLLAQIAANYWTWAYLPWALVPILLSLLSPGAATPGRIVVLRRPTSVSSPARATAARR